jgi:hypothetical protein
MKKCLYLKCGKLFEPNKPKQKFCSAIHRVYWNRDQKSNKPDSTLAAPSAPKPPKKPKSKLPEELEESVDLHKKASPEVCGSPRSPRNLEELKKLCPPELTGFDKSNWISTERQKYGI